MQLVRAVRKAVSSSALIKALGLPRVSNRVSDPRGAVGAGLESSEVEGVRVGPAIDVGRDLEPLVEVVCVDFAEPIDRRLRSGVTSGFLTESRVMTLTPMPELLDAGMNKLVAPSVRFMWIL
jgi:hypothetical protein